MAIFRLVFTSCFLHILLFSVILLKPYQRRISRILDELKTVPADFCPPQRLIKSMREALWKVVAADAGQTEIHIIARWVILLFFRKIQRWGFFLKYYWNRFLWPCCGSGFMLCLWIRIRTRKQCCGSGMFIPGPGSECFHPGSRIQGQKDSGSRIRIRIKEFKYLNPKNVSKL